MGVIISTSTKKNNQIGSAGSTSLDKAPKKIIRVIITDDETKEIVYDVNHIVSISFVGKLSLNIDKYLGVLNQTKNYTVTIISEKKFKIFNGFLKSPINEKNINNVNVNIKSWYTNNTVDKIFDNTYIKETPLNDNLYYVHNLKFKEDLNSGLIFNKKYKDDKNYYDGIFNNNNEIGIVKNNEPVLVISNGGVSVNSKLKINYGLPKKDDILTCDDKDGGLSWNKMNTFKYMPVGCIMMWNGIIVPTGWALCDGKQYTIGGKNLQFRTPNLTDRFIVGYNDANSSNYTEIGAVGGEAFHKLVESEIPTHRHQTSLSETTGGNSYYSTRGTMGNTQVKLSGGYTDNVGGGLAHENRPPYYVLAYIIKKYTSEDVDELLNAGLTSDEIQILGNNTIGTSINYNSSDYIKNININNDVQNSIINKVKKNNQTSVLEFSGTSTLSSSNDNPNISVLLP